MEPTDGIASAIGQAKAGPVLLGGGLRLFEDIGPERTALTIVRWLN
jgi:hypothetical protein